MTAEQGRMQASADRQADEDVETAVARDVTRLKSGWPLIAGWAMGLAALVALIGFVLHFNDVELFLGLVRRADPFWLSAALALQVLTYGAAALVWKVVLARTPCNLPFVTLLKIGFLQIFANQVLPTSGLSGTLIVFHSLLARGVRATIALSGLFLDTLTYYAVYLGLVLLVFGVLWHRHMDGFLAVPLVGAFMAVMCGVLAWLVMMGRWRDRMLPDFLKRFKPVARLAGWMRGMDPQTLRDAPTLLAAGLCQMTVFLLDAGTLWCSAHAVGMELSAWDALAAFLIASVVATVAPLPLGLGSFESAAIMVLHVFGSSAEAGLAATLIFRGMTLWLPMLPGLVFTRREMSRNRRTESPAGPPP